MTMTMVRFSVLACAVALLGACDEETMTGGDDAGVTGGDDAGETSDLPPPEAYVETQTAFSPTTADFSCLGTRTRPIPGDTIEVAFQLRDFQDGFEVPDAMGWIFTDNMISNDCGANCQEFTTNMDGNASVQLPANGWYAYRVFPFEGPTPGTSIFGVFQYNEPAPAMAGGAVEGNSVSGTTINLIPALLGITREEGRAIMAGRITDCVDEHNIANAEVRIYDPDGNYIEPGLGTTDPRYHYFMGVVMGNVPDQTREASSADGLYVVPQVPYADDRPYRIEAWANLDGTYQRISCESARIFQDSVTILNLGPMRADADPACM